MGELADKYKRRSVPGLMVATPASAQAKRSNTWGMNTGDALAVVADGDVNLVAAA